MPRPRDQYDDFTPLRLLSRRLNRQYNYMRKRGDIHAGKGPLSPMSPYNRKLIRKAKREYGSRSARQEIGHPVGSSQARVKEVDLGTTNANTRTLYSVDLLNIAKTDSTFKMDSRFRDIIRVAGIRLSYILTANTTTRNTLVNVAIVGTRDSNTGVINLSNFFRGDSAGDRAIDFSNALDSNLMHNSPINTDDYVVLYRKKYNLGNSTSDNATIVVNDYIKLDRQIRYDSSGDPHQGLRLVYWADGATAAGGSAVLNNWLNIAMRSLTFFHDQY